MYFIVSLQRISLLPSPVTYFFTVFLYLYVIESLQFICISLYLKFVFHCISSTYFCSLSPVRYLSAFLPLPMHRNSKPGLALHDRLFVMKSLEFIIIKVIDNEPKLSIFSLIVLAKTLDNNFKSLHAYHLLDSNWQVNERTLESKMSIVVWKVFHKYLDRQLSCISWIFHCKTEISFILLGQTHPYTVWYTHSACRLSIAMRWVTSSKMHWVARSKGNWREAC